ncbi:aspartyl/asparaginyl beta-hydroxylase isoform X14 [Oreochromis niloticus]|uniref:aspartyl/asparaginyl beta-hydroxylase isoform X14 n=1 Tax=Oreochromis niloticus TaxID=8128 RepID=UPI000DF1DB59|nr:aspartyl/asparaginyl beta-hydroxylase isoform X14 [Oreochromis niloticus]
MERYRHYGTSYTSSPGAAHVEEIHAEEEEEVEEVMYTEEEVEPLLEDETQPLVQETEGKTVPVESKNGKRTEGGGGGDAGGGPKYSVFTWFVVLGLLGVWSSVAVVYFNIVDYDTVIGKLTAYDTDGDGDFDVEDAKVLLGLKEAKRLHVGDTPERQTAAVPLPPPAEDFVPDDPQESISPYGDEANTIDTTGVLLAEPQTEESAGESAEYLTSSKLTQEAELVIEAEKQPEAADVDPQSETPKQTEAEGTSEKQAEDKLKEKAKKKKPKLLNKFDKTIKAEIDAAEKLRKKGKPDEALKAFERLVQQYPQSPRARYGKAQAEDDMAEKLRSNDMLQRAINTYREAAELPDVTSDLLRATLKRRAERQQFLGRMRGSLATLERLVQLFPEDIGLKNDLGVAHLLLGDNKGAKKIYEEVLGVAPDNGFAKVHYGFILKSENKIAESIPYLKEGLESGEPGTDDGRFYFHLGDALQRVGDNSAYDWYELGHKRGHFASLWQRSLYNVNGLKAQPWWTAKETGYTDLVKVLERNWKTIRDEALAVLDQNTGHFVPEEENLREKGDWGQYTLWQQGRKVGNACQGVPKTCALLERFPEATGCKRGQIKFSVMQPGTHVWPHTGPTNCRLRMHLGLVIPKRGCKIRCTNETREWEEGKVLIFDDSFEHEVWQEAESYRLIFIVDVWHPELTQHQRQTLSPI